MKKILILILCLMPLSAFATGPWKPVQFFNHETTTGPSTEINVYQFPDDTTWETVIFGNTSTATFNITIDASIQCIPGTYHWIDDITQDSVVTNSDNFPTSVGYLQGIKFAGYQCVRANIRSKSNDISISLWLSPREDSRN